MNNEFEHNEEHIHTVSPRGHSTAVTVLAVGLAIALAGVLVADLHDEFAVEREFQYLRVLAAAAGVIAVLLSLIIARSFGR